MSVTPPRTGPLFGLCLLLSLMVLSRSASGQNTGSSPLHFYELGIEVNGSCLNLGIYEAATGRHIWSGFIEETGTSPDMRFDTNGMNGTPPIVALPRGVLVLSFRPAMCEGRRLASAINYAWAGSSTEIQPGTFYRPVAGPEIDTYFRLVDGQLNVFTNDSGVSGPLNQFLGSTGWTLPYDRTTLCAATPCNGDGPSDQFFSAGVTVREVPPESEGGPSGFQLVPTFSFKGTVALTSNWGAQTWNVSGLTLKFNPQKALVVQSLATLAATGTTFTAVNPTAGWGGIRIETTGSSFDGVTIERVSAAPYATGAALAFLDSEPRIWNSLLQLSASAGVDGIFADRMQAGLIDNVTIQNLSGSGVNFSGAEVELPSVRNNTIQSNTGHGIFVGYGGYSLLGGNRMLNNAGAGLYAYNAFPHLSATYDGVEGGNVATDNAVSGAHARAGSVVMGGTTSRYLRNTWTNNGQTNPVWTVDGKGPDAWVRDAGSVGHLRNGWWGRPTNPDTTTCAAIPCAGGPRGRLYVDPMLTAAPGGAAFANSTASVAASQAALATTGDATPSGSALERAGEAAAQGRRSDALALWRAAAAEARGRDAGFAAVSQTALLALDGRRAGDVVADDAMGALAGWAERGSPYRTRALAALAQTRFLTGDRTGALEAADALAAEADAAAALEGHYARFHVRLAAAPVSGRAADYRAAAAVLASLERLAPSSEEAAWARHALTMRAGGAVAEAARAAAVAEATMAPGSFATAQAAETEFALDVWPNPTAGGATVAVSLPSPAEVEVVVYDVLGRAVQVLHRGALEAGTHTLHVATETLPAGTFVLRAHAEATSLTRTLTVLR